MPFCLNSSLWFNISVLMLSGANNSNFFENKSFLVSPFFNSAATRMLVSVTSCS
jgi:hypothetical protein